MMHYSQSVRAKSRGGVKTGVVVGAVLVIGAVAGAFSWRQRQIRIEEARWAPIVMPERVARVTDSWDARTLADRLKKSGKIKESAIFLRAAEEIGLKKVAEGGYVLPPKAGPRDLAALFHAGPTLLKVTFPEGWTAAQMARRLVGNGFVAAAEFKKTVYPAATAVSPLEGRLFPDTYYLPIKGNAANLAAPLRERFDEVWKGLPKDTARWPKVKGKTLTQHEVITLASLVEREAASPAEMPTIAGVLLNRLRQGMRLQCDASVQYARERAVASGQLTEGHKERLLYADLEIDSPYNTYRNSGLPPGAICNPGKDALLAALMPKTTPNLFYVLSPKLDTHRFAVTYADHLRNIRLARQERAANE
jgi:UPF0755 protein